MAAYSFHQLGHGALHHQMRQTLRHWDHLPRVAMMSRAAVIQPGVKRLMRCWLALSAIYFLVKGLLRLLKEASEIPVHCVAIRGRTETHVMESVVLELLVDLALLLTQAETSKDMQLRICWACAARKDQLDEVAWCWHLQEAQGHSCLS